MVAFLMCRAASLKVKRASFRFSPFARSMGAGIATHQFGGSTLSIRGDCASAEMEHTKTRRRQRMDQILKK
jgi:hypothetical protein